MARSVSVPSKAVHVCYTAMDASDEDHYDLFQDELDLMRSDLHNLFPSVTGDDRWLDNEDHVIASNKFADFGVSEYCGLVAMWVAPRESDHPELRDRWIASIGKKFESAVKGLFGKPLRLQGRFSNGEAFFQPEDGEQRGELGLGYSSKEGWL